MVTNMDTPDSSGHNQSDFSREGHWTVSGFVKTPQEAVGTKLLFF